MKDLYSPTERGPPLSPPTISSALTLQDGIEGLRPPNPDVAPSKTKMNLTAAQLADLVNYTLGLPVKLGDRRILEPAMDPCLLSGWSMTEKARHRAELWCLHVLLELGVFPRERLERLGLGKRRRRPRTAPEQLSLFAAKPVKRVEQLLQQRREWKRVAG
jgi:hypothetical protein